jgi:hypothetical protein
MQDPIDVRTLAKLLDAAKRHGGHVTIMKFTTNWRICLGTPIFIDDREQIEGMPCGKTFESAALQALEAEWRPENDPDYLDHLEKEAEKHFAEGVN